MWLMRKPQSPAKALSHKSERCPGETGRLNALASNQYTRAACESLGITPAPLPLPEPVPKKVEVLLRCADEFMAQIQAPHVLNWP
jgi:hypothetical protein